MIFTRGLRVCLAVAPVDLRRSFEGLALLVRESLHEDERSSQIFVFTNQRHNRIRLLYWDGTGLWILSKKLEAGNFAWRAALLPENLPVEETRLVPLVVQAQPEKFRQIGEAIVERLERIPGKLIRLRLVRPRFVRIDEPYAAPLTAPAPPALIEGGFFGPQFMIDMVLGKYLYHQPLYRQAKGMEWESGVRLSLATMCQTIARLADAVQPVVDCMARDMWKSGRVQMDLTPVRCLSREHDGGSFLGQMWVSAAMDGGEVIYTWDKSKEVIARERGFDAALLLVLRQKHARRVMALLRRRIDATIAAVRPQTHVGRACLYAMGQWDALQVYLDHSDVPIDNNGVERAIRPCAVGKKNYLFIGDVGAGQRSATFYSLLGSCLRRGINPREYLHWLFARLPLATNLTVHTLTPAAYAALMAEAAEDHRQAAA
jgi:transposase